MLTSLSGFFRPSQAIHACKVDVDIGIYGCWQIYSDRGRHDNDGTLAFALTDEHKIWANSQPAASILNTWGALTNSSGSAGFSIRLSPVNLITSFHSPNCVGSAQEETKQNNISCCSPVLTQLGQTFIFQGEKHTESETDYKTLSHLIRFVWFHPLYA